MKEFNLNDEELELLDSLESNEWSSVDNLKDEIISHQNTAKINLRMSSKDLEDIKTFAVEEGLAYQTLMSSILHKFITGRLVDKQTG